MKRRDMVAFGTEQLIISENSVEQALSDTAGLASSLSRMRVDSSLSILHGQDAMREVSNAIKALTKARGALCRAHEHLVTVRTNIVGRDEFTGGDEGKPPKGNGGITADPVALAPAQSAVAA